MNYPLSPGGNPCPPPFPPPPPMPALKPKAAGGTLSAAKKCYTKVGLALCLMLLLHLLLPNLAVILLQLFGIPIPTAMSYGISALALYGAAIPVFYLLIKGERAEPPAKHSLSFGHLLTAFIMCFPPLYLGSLMGRLENFILSSFKGGISNPVEETTGELGIGLTFLFVVILAPFFEELVFRKLLLDRAGKYGYAPAAALSGLVFGLFHGNFLQFFYALFLGLFFAFLYLRTGKLRYTVTLHMLVNFIGSIIPMFLQRLADSPLSLLADGISEIYGLMTVAALIAGTVLLIASRKKLTMPELPGEIESGKEHKLLLAPGMILFILLCACFFLLFML